MVFLYISVVHLLGLYIGFNKLTHNYKKLKKKKIVIKKICIFLVQIKTVLCTKENVYTYMKKNYR